MIRSAENVQVYPEMLKPSSQVGTWRVVERLGVGGFGAVYRVEDVARPGEFYALKLALRPEDERTEREVALLMDKAVHRNVVRFLGCGRWPHPKTGYLYFVMDWVAGRPMDTWAEEVNPTLREVAQVAAKVAMALDELHGAGVLHRDLKPAHILIQESDGEPVLIDFGLGAYAGAAIITKEVIPPGTLHLRSPESVRFYQENRDRPGARYEYQPTDDLYALGVSLFRVVTGHYPFPSHLPPDLLYPAIDGQRPPAPVRFNRRVPLSLSDVVMRLLARTPGERYQTGADLHAALMAAVSTDGPTPWDATVFAWEETQVTEPDGSRRVIRRPEWPTRSATPPAVTIALDSAPPRLRPAPLGRPEAKGNHLSVVTPPHSGRRQQLVALLGVVLIACVSGLTAWTMHALGHWPPFKAQQIPIALADVAMLPPSSSGEAAPSGQVLQDPPRVTVPTLVETTAAPAAPSEALPKKEDAPVMKQSKPSASVVNKVGMMAVGIAGACLACAGPQVRPAPPPEECPPGALESMAELGMKLGEAEVYVFDVIKGQPHVITVREGNAVLRLGDEWSGLPGGGLLYGKLYLSDRVYGRFTLVRTAKGRTYPVCIEMLTGGLQRGMERKPGSTADSAIIWTTGRANPVDRFE